MGHSLRCLHPSSILSTKQVPASWPHYLIYNMPPAFPTQLSLVLPPDTSPNLYPPFTDCSHVCVSSLVRGELLSIPSSQINSSQLFKMSWSLSNSHGSQTCFGNNLHPHPPYLRDSAGGMWTLSDRQGAPSFGYPIILKALRQWAIQEVVRAAGQN